MPEEVIADVPAEGETLKPANTIEKALDNIDARDKGEKTPAESLPEKKQAVKQPPEGVSSEEPPKDSKGWMKMRKTNAELKTQLEDLRTQFESFKATPIQPQTQEPLPQWWMNAYGNTAESQQAYRQYQENTKAERDRIKDEIKNEILSEQQKGIKTEEEAQEFINSQTEEMKEEGLEFEVNELMKFIVDTEKEYNAPNMFLDTQGNYDLRRALKLMQSLQPKPKDQGTEAKKRIASETLRSKGTPEETGIPVLTKKALRGNWREAKI